MEQKLEIRYHKKIVRLLSALFITFLVIFAVVDIIKREDLDKFTIVSHSIGGAIVLSSIYGINRKVNSGTPVLIIDGNGVFYNNYFSKEPFQKVDIESLSVVKVDESGYFLIVNTTRGRSKLNLNFLELPPDKIEAFIKDYL